MRKRITIGSAMILVLAALLWLDAGTEGSVVCAVTTAVTAAALYELFTMARRAGLEPFRAVGIAFGAGLVPYLAVGAGLVGPHLLVAYSTAPLFALILVLTGVAAGRSDGLEPQLKNIAVTAFGVLYVGLPMALLARTRFLSPGEGWGLVILVVGVAKASDIGAYFTGTVAGRRKLAPRVSPHKTVEGALGGLLASVVAAVAITYGMGLRTLTGLEHGAAATVAFGLLVGAGSQAGDLTESLVKRSVRIKDSGSMVPAFGGVLDLIDSFLIAAPVAYLLLSVFAGTVR